MTATPINLKVTPGADSLSLGWSVNTTEGLGGFLVHWRKKAAPALPWNTVELLSTVRSYALTGLAAETYEVEVRALVAGGMVSATATPLVEPPPPPGVRYGLVLNDDIFTPVCEDSIRAVGATLVRTQTATVAQGKAYIARGISVLPIVSSPSEAAEWKGVVALMEGGNEDNYEGGPYPNTKAGGESYARAQLKNIEQVGNGVMLVQASDAGIASSGWIDGLFAAVPNLDSLVAGYTIHPYYGGAKAGQTDTWGIPMMERMVAGLEKYKATKPYCVTEWGETSANGKELTGKPSNLTYAEAAEIVTQEVPELLAAAKGRVSLLTVYCSHDLHTWAAEPNWENFFGVVDFNGQPKEPYTAAVKTLLAS